MPAEVGDVELAPGATAISTSLALSQHSYVDGYDDYRSEAALNVWGEPTDLDGTVIRTRLP